MNEHSTLVEAYLTLSQALEAKPEAYAAVLHPEVEQIEYPNQLTKSTQHRDLEGILDVVRVGRELLLNPTFEQVRMRPGTDGSLVLEAYWSATAMSDIGLMVRGQQVGAQLCVIFEFKDSLIFRMYTYRCYEPFAG